VITRLGSGGGTDSFNDSKAIVEEMVLENTRRELGRAQHQPEMCHCMELIAAFAILLSISSAECANG